VTTAIDIPDCSPITSLVHQLLATSVVSGGDTNRVVIPGLVSLNIERCGILEVQFSDVTT
jgi:hypothetical protein